MITKKDNKDCDYYDVNGICNIVHRKCSLFLKCFFKIKKNKDLRRKHGSNRNN